MMGMMRRTPGEVGNKQVLESVRSALPPFSSIFNRTYSVHEEADNVVEPSVFKKRTVASVMTFVREGLSADTDRNGGTGPYPDRTFLHQPDFGTTNTASTSMP